MKNHLKTFLFVIILGTVTSALLLGMDLLTRDRIRANEEALLKSSVLDASQIAYTFTNIHDIFEDEIEIIESNDLIFYIHRTSGNISFNFSGGGVWGPIIGIITLKDDFETIVAIKILQQEETPGLGGVVAEERYLKTFIGKKMMPELIIAKDPAPNQENEVDAITGATNTSNQFSLILNTDYTRHKIVWQNLGN